MDNTIADLGKKKILVVSDHRELSTAIPIGLSNCLGTDVIKLAPGPPERQESLPENGDFDLIVVALSSPSSEAVVLLSRASLVERVGRVPLLIISDRPFYADLDVQVFHLDFPFDISDLLDRVKLILHGDPDLALMNARRSRRRRSFVPDLRSRIP